METQKIVFSHYHYVIDKIKELVDLYIENRAEFLREISENLDNDHSRAVWQHYYRRHHRCRLYVSEPPLYILFGCPRRRGEERYVIGVNDSSEKTYFMHYFSSLRTTHVREIWNRLRYDLDVLMLPSVHLEPVVLPYFYRTRIQGDLIVTVLPFDYRRFNVISSAYEIYNSIINNISYTIADHVVRQIEQHVDETDCIESEQRLMTEYKIYNIINDTLYSNVEYVKDALRRNRALMALAEHLSMRTRRLRQYFLQAIRNIMSSSSDWSLVKSVASSISCWDVVENRARERIAKTIREHLIKSLSLTRSLSYIYTFNVETSEESHGVYDKVTVSNMLSNGQRSIRHEIIGKVELLERFRDSATLRALTDTIIIEHPEHHTVRLKVRPGDILQIHMIESLLPRR